MRGGQQTEAGGSLDVCTHRDATGNGKTGKRSKAELVTGIGQTVKGRVRHDLAEK